MEFKQAIETGFNKYFEFSGRASRSEFWYFVLFLLLANIAVGILASIVDIDALIKLWNLAVLLPALGVTVRRLHDTDKSGWWILIELIPLIGAIIILIFCAMQGTPGENRFGPPPQV